MTIASSMFCASCRSEACCNAFNWVLFQHQDGPGGRIVAEGMSLSDVRFGYGGGRRRWVRDVPHVSVGVSKMANLG